MNYAVERLYAILIKAMMICDEIQGYESEARSHSMFSEPPERLSDEFVRQVEAAVAAVRKVLP